ncbi:MAG: hypothetical protein J3K34DRAFT_412366 [Monoraphidium minutum]|nr:MAG: hypothetical protein J3K34DRAFT_412366 [Monoraphidium minutum]
MLHGSCVLAGRHGLCEGATCARACISRRGRPAPPSSAHWKGARSAKVQALLASQALVLVSGHACTWRVGFRHQSKFKQPSKLRVLIKIDQIRIAAKRVAQVNSGGRPYGEGRGRALGRRPLAMRRRQAVAGERRGGVGSGRHSPRATLPALLREAAAQPRVGGGQKTSREVCQGAGSRIARAAAGIRQCAAARKGSEAVRMSSGS